MNIEHLTWDSEFFQKKIGRIDVPAGELVDIELLSKQARDSDYQLLYLFSASELKIKGKISETTHLVLADRKVIYEKFIQSEDGNSDSLSEYTSLTVSDELENLAYLSGQHSRFRIDSNFSDDDFYRLYKTWISKSISREIANSVFVIEESGKIVGMVTLKVTEKMGHIGLIAVSTEIQSKGYGKRLIDGCINSLLDKGVNYIEVPTQMSNIQACRFYEKCGFTIQSVTYIYHLSFI